MPVYKLKTEMSYEELLNWSLYFEERPVGWRDDDRTMKILQANGVKESAGNLFLSLSKIYAKESERKVIDGHISEQAFKQSGLFAKLASSVGGDKLAFFEEHNE